MTKTSNPSDHSSSNTNTVSATEKAQQFLAVADLFKLGDLSTEKPHPVTEQLSHLAQTRVSEALAALKQVDVMALEKLQPKLALVTQLKRDIERCLETGHRVFLCGCGATGRLSLTLETLWRGLKADTPLNDKVVSFMAGGDVALIASIEKFEDYPDYGARQLEELGFQDGDLLIASTEGGETPWVIGACERARDLSPSRRPYFLYCNPDSILCDKVERSRRVIQDPNIHKINLDVGPMSISGSTRMQATTVLMASIGWAMWSYRQADQKVVELYEEFKALVLQTDFSKLAPFIEHESACYQRGEHVFYATEPSLGISILTDTTERSPTFSLYPFENQDDLLKYPSLCYLLFPEIPYGDAAWESLLYRKPRTLEWPELQGVASVKRLKGFNFSGQLPELRKHYLPTVHERFSITWRQESLFLELGKLKHRVDLPGKSFLNVHLLLKLMLNDISTTIMGRLGRYHGNVMTWVRPSNNKLIDRTVRYAKLLLNQKGIDCAYETLVQDCCEIMEYLPKDQPVVLAMVDRRSKQ